MKSLYFLISFVLAGYVNADVNCPLVCSPADVHKTIRCRYSKSVSTTVCRINWSFRRDPSFFFSTQLFTGDNLVFQTPVEGEVVMFEDAAAFANCDVERSITIPTVGLLESKFSTTGSFYFGNSIHCANGRKVVIRVVDYSYPSIDITSLNLTAKDNALSHGGLEPHHQHDDMRIHCHRHGRSCHCHTYEEILCPEDEPAGYTTYNDTVNSIVDNCQGLIAGNTTVSTCPQLCAHSMQLLHVHYTKCPLRTIDSTFSSIYASSSNGLCIASTPADTVNCPVATTVTAASVLASGAARNARRGGGGMLFLPTIVVIAVYSGVALQ